MLIWYSLEIILWISNFVQKSMVLKEIPRNPIANLFETIGKLT